MEEKNMQETEYLRLCGGGFNGAPGNLVFALRSTA